MSCLYYIPYPIIIILATGHRITTIFRTVQDTEIHGVKRTGYVRKKVWLVFMTFLALCDPLCIVTGISLATWLRSVVTNMQIPSTKSHLMCLLSSAFMKRYNAHVYVLLLYNNNKTINFVQHCQDSQLVNQCLTQLARSYPTVCMNWRDSLVFHCVLIGQVYSCTST